MDEKFAWQTKMAGLNISVANNFYGQDNRASARYPVVDAECPCSKRA